MDRFTNQGSKFRGNREWRVGRNGEFHFGTTKAFRVVTLVEPEGREKVRTRRNEGPEGTKLSFAESYSAQI